MTTCYGYDTLIYNTSHTIFSFKVWSLNEIKLFAVMFPEQLIVPIFKSFVWWTDALICLHYVTCLKYSNIFIRIRLTKARCEALGSRHLCAPTMKLETRKLRNTWELICDFTWLFQYPQVSFNEDHLRRKLRGAKLRKLYDIIM